jgi:hypothetical protein
MLQVQPLLHDSDAFRVSKETIANTSSDPSTSCPSSKKQLKH